MRLKLILAIIFLALFSACELDNFLFNEKKITRYELPDNTIPDSLLEMVTFESDNNTLYSITSYFFVFYAKEFFN